MKCAHCGISIYETWDDTWLAWHHNVINWQIRVTRCPACAGYEIDIMDHNVGGGWRMVHPHGVNRGPIPPEVPPQIASDYREACSVLPVSPKASAALARRCLQNVLRTNGYKDRDLAKEIEQVLNESEASKAIPQSLRTTIDGIRNFGNFSAHPVTDITTLQIIDVDPHEAEWCLEILEEMFEHFYVRPAHATARKAALDAKLMAAGKPPSK